MIKKRRFLSLVLLVSGIITITIIFLSFNQHQADKFDIPNETKNGIPARDVVEMHGDLNSEYETITSLKKDAEIIAEVTIPEVNSFLYMDIPFNKSRAQIDKVYKGNLNKGDKITILETGGIIEDTEYVFEENPVFKKGDRAIVFLEEYTGGDVIDNGYVILGAFQGKFKIQPQAIVTPPENSEGELAKIGKLSELELTLKK